MPFIELRPLAEDDLDSSIPQKRSDKKRKIRAKVISSDSSVSPTPVQSGSVQSSARLRNAAKKTSGTRESYSDKKK